MQKRQILYQVNYSVQKRVLMFGFSLQVFEKWEQYTLRTQE
jgi:hypothetical protein